MQTMLDSYPQVYSLGHKALVNLFKAPVIVQEKIDGSQFSFGRFVDHEVWEVKMRSKGCKVTPENPGMFSLAVTTVEGLAPELTPGWIYRCEYLSKPKHNVLAYDRIPTGGLICYDIQQGMADFLSPVEMALECKRIGLEIVPFFSDSMGYRHPERIDMDWLKALLDHISCLGGQKLEGVVVKNYSFFGADGKPLFGKFVSEKFKEVHAKEWKNQNPGTGDIVDLLTARYRTEARWQKAVMHLAERGEIENSPRDIGLLFKEVSIDLLKDCKEEIKEILFDWAWKRKLSRSVTAGLAEWYKEKLAEQQFEGDGH